MKTKLQIKDLNSELMNLYYQDGSFNTKELQLFDSRVAFDKETGEEKDAENILNPKIVEIEELNEDLHDLNAWKESRSVYKNEFYFSHEDMAWAKKRQFQGTEAISSAATFAETFGAEYEADFHEQLEQDVHFEHNDFITDAQKDLNFKFYMRKLAEANNFRKLKVVRESVLTGQKGSWFFMKKEDLKTFWAEYNAKKEVLNNLKTQRSA